MEASGSSYTPSSQWQNYVYGSGSYGTYPNVNNSTVLTVLANGQSDATGWETW